MAENNNIDPLSQTEYDLVSEAIYRLVKQYPFPGERISINYLTGTAKKNICVIPTQDNAQYRKKFVTGGFEATVNFQIAYKCFPTSDMDKIKAQEVVAGIMKWLENTKYLPLLTEDRTIEKIEKMDSFSAIDDEGKDGNMVFVSTATLTYRAE